jgi:hypothetical protein
VVGTKSDKILFGFSSVWSSAGKGVTDDGLFDLLYANSLEDYGIMTTEADGRFRRVMARLQHLIAMDVGALTFWQYMDTNRYFTLMSLIGVGSIPRVYGVFVAIFDWSSFAALLASQGPLWLIFLPRTAVIREVSGFADTDPVFYYCFLVAYFTADANDLIGLFNLIRKPSEAASALRNAVLSSLTGMIPMIGFTMFWYLTPRFFINGWVTVTLVSVVFTTLFSSCAACAMVKKITEAGAPPHED